MLCLYNCTPCLRHIFASSSHQTYLDIDPIYLTSPAKYSEFLFWCVLWIKPLSKPLLQDWLILKFGQKFICRVGSKFLSILDCQIYKVIGYYRIICVVYFKIWNVISNNTDVSISYIMGCWDIVCYNNSTWTIIILWTGYYSV